MIIEFNDTPEGLVVDIEVIAGGSNSLQSTAPHIGQSIVLCTCLCMRLLRQLSLQCALMHSYFVEHLLSLTTTLRLAAACMAIDPAGINTNAIHEKLAHAIPPC